MAHLPLRWLLRPWLEHAAQARRGWRWAFRLAMAGAALLLLMVGLLFIYATRFNWVRGSVQSVGPGVNTWTTSPDSCARDPQDGRPVGQSSTIVSMLWWDRTLLDPMRNWTSWQTQPDNPLRLDLSQSDGKTIAQLTTVKTDDALTLNDAVCQNLYLNTWPEEPLVPEGRPALGGVLTLDCVAQGRHIRARLRFDHCAF